MRKDAVKLKDCGKREGGGDPISVFHSFLYCKVYNGMLCLSTPKLFSRKPQ